MRRIGSSAAVLLLLGLAACGGDRPADDGSEGAAAEAPSPMEGWYTRADGLEHGGNELEVLREPEGFGFRTTHGGIAFREEDVRSVGPYRLQAAIQQRGGEPGDTRSYGLMIGGGDLLVDRQSYTAFLIRSTGEFTVERRQGGASTSLVEWTETPLLRTVESAGDVPMNILTVAMEGDDVVFLLNNGEATRLPANQVQPLGALGLRVDEGLNLTVVEWFIR